MNDAQFIACLERHEIPPEAPDQCLYGSGIAPFEISLERFQTRSTVTQEFGMWAIITEKLAERLAQWIGQRKCLEIMSGAGWLAKALSEQGVDIIATDDYSWKHTKDAVYHSLPLEASAAVQEFSDRDVLICSWPPYKESAFVDALKLWGTEKPIIYIGESASGCNATYEFFEHFDPCIKHDISIEQWDGIHDYVEIGFWRTEKQYDYSDYQ